MKKSFADWQSQVTPFQKKVYEVTLKIPKGEVRTYGWVARAVGQPKAARAVGQALKRNQWAPQIPCHRVVASARGSLTTNRSWRVVIDGSLCGYSASGGLAAKRKLLQREGVLVE